MKSPKSILVTGCAGFIASNLIKEFKQRYPKTNIVGVDNFSTGHRELLDPRITFYEGSVADSAFLDRIFKKHRPEYVFHFAALPQVSYSVEHPAETTVANIAGTVTILEKSRDYGVKRVMYSSSSAIYGLAKHIPTNEKDNEPNPESPYGLQKLVGEPFCRLFGKLYGLDTVCLRYFNVFGPGQYGGSAYATVICNWLDGIYFPKKKKPFIEGDGKQTRDFCYVGNVVLANILAMESAKPFRGEAFNIGSGTKIDLLAVKRDIEKYTGQSLALERRPARLGDVRSTQADISKAKKWLGYSPETDFEEGLKKTIEWFEKRVGDRGKR
jgi:UDP-glucose 4-epimerase